MTGITGEMAGASGSAAREMPSAGPSPTPTGKSEPPAGRPRTSAGKARTSAGKARSSAGKPPASAKTPKTSAGTPGTPGSPAAVSASPAAVPGSPAAVPASPVAVPASPAEATFAAAVAAFMAGRDAHSRPDLLFEDVPAPKRLAPYATAIAATVQRDDADVAWGRLILLYDPDGQQGWDGFFRLVAYVRADVEPEMAADPLLGEVGWSWLSEALDAHAPGYAVPSGTVTRVITEGFGAKRDELPLTGFELRASWSPVGPDGPYGSAENSDLDTIDLSAHIAAWCDCLSAAAGLEPPGTRALRQPGHG
jgi:hypothetical protein